MRPVLLLPLAIGCSEYDITAKEDAAAADDDTAFETGGPGDTARPSCDDFPAPAAPEASVDEACQEAVPPGTFTPVVEWQWVPSQYPSWDQVMMTPIVTTLGDDAVPDIVFVAFDAGLGDRSTGVLRALDGASGAEQWSLQATLGSITGVGGIAAGDVDADGFVEFFVCTTGGGLLAVDHAGVERWLAAGVCESGECDPAIHDLYGDGSPEIVVGRHVVDGTGTVLWAGEYGRGSSGGYGSMSFGADVDLDGELEIVAGNTVYEPDGTVLWYSGGPDGQPAIADFDLDGDAEVVVTTPSGLYRYDAETGALDWGPVAFTGGGWGGPPTVADFDGDGAPEFGVAGYSYYVVHEADGSVLWSAPTAENSVAITGSSVFDFEGDGAAEVVYADETTLWVFDGATGAPKLAVSDQASATVSEYPVVADVDGDDEAELVLASNDYYLTGLTGITVYGDADHSWVDAGRAWNQHAWYQDHVADDGSIPATTTPSWLTHNSFRAGKTEGLPTYGLPDLEPGAEPCLDTCALDEVTLWVSVANRGLAHATGVALSVRAADGTSRYDTTADADSGAMAWVGPVALARDDFGAGGVSIAVDGDGAWEECDESNNAVVVAWPCPD